MHSVAGHCLLPLADAGRSGSHCRTLSGPAYGGRLVPSGLNTQLAPSTHAHGVSFLLSLWPRMRRGWRRVDAWMRALGQLSAGPGAGCEAALLATKAGGKVQHEPAQGTAAARCAHGTCTFLGSHLLRPATSLASHYSLLNHQAGAWLSTSPAAYSRLSPASLASRRLPPAMARTPAILLACLALFVAALASPVVGRSENGEPVVGGCCSRGTYSKGNVRVAAGQARPKVPEAPHQA